MRFRSVLFLMITGLFLWIPTASAQKKVFATVNPNLTSLNKDADLYDPATGAITHVPNSMSTARERHVAIRLDSGKVLIAGGYNNRELQGAELFNPADQTFTATGTKVATNSGPSNLYGMISARSDAAGVLMSNGDAFVIGGYNGIDLQTIDVYNPAKGTFSLFGNRMTIARQNPAATLLKDGTLLITGGYTGSAFLSNAERYDPTTLLFETTPGIMKYPREGHTSTLLSSGKVLITGGCNNAVSGEIVCDNFLSTAEIFDPATGLFTATGSMTTARRGHTAVLLPNGKVLLAGGTDGKNTLSTAELYDPEKGIFTSTGSMGTPRNFHTASMMSNGKVLIAGGESDSPLASLEVYDPATNTFVFSGVTMSAKRAGHVATVLNDGKVLLTGGRNQALLIFDINVHNTNDDIAPDVYFTPDSQHGFVPYTGSGVVAVFTPQTGIITNRITTGGKPFCITPILDGQKLALVSALDNKIFIINTSTLQAENPYTFNDTFGFGSVPAISSDGKTAYISATSAGAVIKFDVATGKTLGRLANLTSPARITITKDGSTIFIVDTIANTVVIADAATMTTKATFRPLDRYPVASFSIYNKVILKPDESIAMIPTSSYASGTTTYSGALLFDPKTGNWILGAGADLATRTTTEIKSDLDEGQNGYYLIGYQPGYATLLPDGSRYMVLTQNYLSLVPTIDPRTNPRDAADDTAKNNPYRVKNYVTGTGPFLGSSNAVFSSDNAYVFYAAATKDTVYQQDLKSGAVVGSFPVGDKPDVSVDQASSLAITPDNKVLAVVNFSSNELDLLTDSIVFKQTKYISQQDQFTGLSLINLSNSSAEVTITAMTDSGTIYDTNIDLDTTYDDLTNPATVILDPHVQKSVDVSELFNLKNETSNIGYLVIESLQPILAGYTATGQIQSSFLSSHISSMQSNPLYRNYANYLTDFIIPEIPNETGASAEINLVNPTYAAATYTLNHYGTLGTVIETQSSKTLNAASRETQKISDVVSNTNKGQVLIAGGVAANKTRSSSAIFTTPNQLADTSASARVGRYGHSAALLPDGKVLLAGGRNGFSILKNAELFNPADRTYSYTPGSMRIERYRHSATRLGNGMVLLAGGQNSDAINRTAELYNSATGSFSYTSGLMTTPRDAHTATSLNNGKILLVGGLDGVGVTATAELYDPATDTFQATGSMSAARAFHTATLLQDGTVLITGGYNGSYLNSAELYNPQTGTFRTVSAMNGARSNHAAVLLSNNTVMVTGGIDADTVLTGGLDTAEIFDPKTQLFARTTSKMKAHRSMHQMVNLLDDTTGSNNDNIVIIGGYGFLTVVCDTTNTKATATDCNANSTLDSEEQLPKALDSAEVYSPISGLFAKTTTNMADSRQEFTAILLQEGIQAGYIRIQSDNGLMSTEIYNALRGGATTSANGINVDKYVGIKNIFSPRFVISSSGRNTLLNLINTNDDKVATVTINLHASSNGSILATTTYTINKNAQLRGDLWDIFSNASNLQGQAGWLEIISDVDKLVGTVSFTNSNKDYLANFELSGSPMNHFVYPLVSEDSDYETEISLLNPGSATNVTIELWNANGQVDNTRTISMGAKTSFSMTLHQIFPSMSNHGFAYVVVKSDAPLHASGELRYRNLRFISSVPPVVYPE
jgi:hypothetical protein